MIDLEKENYDFSDLMDIMVLLRSPGGCPWDGAQTHDSIRKNFIEEVYEVCEAIDNRDNALMCEELGDVLLQVVFHTRIAQEDGAFSMDEVCDGICKKLIRRHPHLFPVSDASLMGKTWDEIKQAEKNQTTGAEAAAQVARTLPALMYADKVQTRIKRTGFDWDSVAGALEKVGEETAELRQAIAQGTNVEEELGDLLFAAVNVANMQKIDPEQALMRASDKFCARFARIEQAGRDLGACSQAELQALWKQAKDV